MSAVERRYAQALLLTAQSPEQAEEIGKSLSDFSETMRQSHELCYFLLNPVVPDAAKKDALKAILPEEIPDNAANFLYLLVDKSRLSYLSGILNEYRREMARLQDIAVITVTSAQPLEQPQIDEIAKLYIGKYGVNHARVENIVKPSLLGGIRVQIGDVLTDDSLTGRLRGLADTLRRH